MVSNEIHEKVVKIVNDTLTKAKGIWYGHVDKIGSLSVGWENKKVGTAGLAYRGRSLVTFNPTYVDQPDFWETTIVHEVAHHLQRWIYPRAKQAHGPEFREIMARLGKSGRTHHSMVTDEYKKKHPHEYVCPTCEKSIFVSDIIHRRMQIRSGRFCVATPRCKYARKSIVLKTNFKKEVDVKEIIPQSPIVQKPVIPTVQPKKVGAATLADILGLNPHWK